MDEEPAQGNGTFDRVYRDAGPRVHIDVLVMHGMHSPVDPIPIQKPVHQIEMRAVDIGDPDKQPV